MVMPSLKDYKLIKRTLIVTNKISDALSNSAIPIMLALSWILTAVLISLIYGNFKYETGYNDAKYIVARDYEQKIAEEKRQHEAIAEEVEAQARKYISEQLQKVKVEKVYVDRVVEKPVTTRVETTTRSVISSNDVDRLNSRRVVR